MSKMMKMEIFVVIAIIFLFRTMFFQGEKSQDYEALCECKKDLKTTDQELQECQQSYERLKKKGENGYSQEHQFPPKISLSEESSRFRFRSGSIELSDSFKRSLREDIAPKINRYLSQWECDEIVITGYTDTQKIELVRKKSNSDIDLIRYLEGEEVELVAGSNAELGLYRAAAIRRFFINENLLNVSFSKIIVQSRGQVYLQTNEVASFVDKADPKMRRIEIEVTKSE